MVGAKSLKASGKTAVNWTGRLLAGILSPQIVLTHPVASMLARKIASLFASRSAAPTPSRLMQLHEDLALLQEGTEEFAAGERIKRDALSLAQRLREELRLPLGPEPSLELVLARRCQVQRISLVHVPLAAKDCFFIAMYHQDASSAHAHLVFDIGAEYQRPFLECPDFGVCEEATEDNLRHWIPRLAEAPDAFAIVERRDGTYMQVYADDRGFHLEHQLVTTGCHYRTAQPVSSEAAVDTLVSYACGKYEWANRAWDRMVL